MPNSTTLKILLNLAKKSPIIVPIFEIERSIPDKNIDNPSITPRDPKRKLISKKLPTPPKKLSINTKTTIGRTALVFFLYNLKI